MTARQVHAVIAAGVKDPRLLARWRAHPDELAALGVAPGSIDLAALEKFAGLALKVRHNPLRDLFPSSFRLMNVAGLEIEIFSAYAADHAEEAYAATTAERAREFIAFLGRWLRRDRDAHALLWDLIRHEHALDQLASPRARTRTAGRGPELVGDVVLHEMSCDPRETAAMLQRSRPDLDRVERDPRFFCYQRSDTLRMVELDAFGYHALELVDGNRSMGAISRALGLGAPTAAFRRCLRELGQAGLVRLE